MKSSTLYLLGIISVFFIGLYFGLAGVDYGPQWDQKNITGFVKHYIRTESILPGEYHYPPGSSYVASTTLIPYVVPLIQRYGLNWIPTQRHLIDEVLNSNNQSFALNVRRTFVVFTMLGILWTGLAAAQRDWLSAFVAAAAIAFSWEISYQSRIVHPDGPTMAFVALSILFSMLAYYRRKPFDYRVWLCLAVVAAAAATATKYTAGVSIFMVLIIAWATLSNEKPFPIRILLWIAALLVVFGVVFLILVPGAILENSIFVYQLIRDQEIYAAGHGLQTVAAGWDHVSRIFLYIFQAAFSYNRVLAVFFPTLALIGIFSLFAEPNRRDRSLALALAGIPLLYIFFLATHRALFARNLLFLLPGFAMLAGFGFSWLLHRLRAYSPTWRYALIGALLVVLIGNVAWLRYTVSTIQTRTGGRFADEALQEISNQSDQSVYITPAALQLLGDRSLPPNATLQVSGEADLVLFAYRGDTIDETEGSWPVNAPGASPQIFGALEINMDWYANWPGTERLVLADPSIAWQDGVRLLLRNSSPAPAQLSPETVLGTLTLDGEQFFIEVEETQRVNILNSANPNVILALRPLLDSEITMTGNRDDVDGPAAWYLLSANGIEILRLEDLRYEYNSSRLMSYLADGQKACIEQILGPAQFKNLVDTVVGFVDLTDEELETITTCT